jgi:hypothetical protein
MSRYILLHHCPGQWCLQFRILLGSAANVPIKVPIGSFLTLCMVTQRPQLHLIIAVASYAHLVQTPWWL